MVTKPVVIAVLCVGFFIILQALVPKAMARNNPTFEDRLMMKGHRAHERKNYLEQEKRDNEIIGSFENGLLYDLPFDPERNPEELSAFIIDYANMIRNDVILLDKSVETRTRKRGNINVKSYNQAITDPTCTCHHKEKEENLKFIFGKDVFPQKILTRKCHDNELDSCRAPYQCQENQFNITILRMKSNRDQEINIEIHNNLNISWYAMNLPVSVGCTCVPAYSGTANN